MAKTKAQAVCGGQVTVYLTRDDLTGIVTDVELVNEHKDQWTVTVRSAGSGTEWTLSARGGQTVALATQEKSTLSNRAAKFMTGFDARDAQPGDFTKRLSLELQRG